MLDPFILLRAVRDDAGRLIDLQYLEANDAAVAYNQLTREQMIGARLLDLFPGQLEQGPLRQYFHTIETGEPTVLDDYAYPHEILGQERRYDIRATKAGDGLALTWRDVTDRLRTAHQLAESEAHHRMIVDNSSDTIMLSTDARTFTWLSESTVRVLEYPPEALIGHPVTEHIHPDDIPLMIESIRRSEQTGEVALVRARWQLPDGSYCWIESTGRPIDPTAGRDQPGRVVTIRRVDEQVRLEQELVERERLYRLLTENTSDVVLLADPGLVLRWASPSVTDLLGWRPADLVGRLATDFIEPDDLPGLLDEIAAANDERRDSLYRYRWRTADGGFRWLEGRGRLVSEGGLEGRVVRLRDIDDEVGVIHELEERERVFRLLAENSTDVVILAREDTTAVWVSPSVETTLGWQPSDLVGHTAAEFTHPDDWPAGRTQEPRHLNVVQRMRVRSSSGDYRWMETEMRALPTEAGQPRRLAVRLTDVDARVRSEELHEESDRLYRLLADNSSDVVLLTANDTTIEWASPSATATFGWQAEQLLGRRAVDFVHPDDGATVRAAIEHSNETMTDFTTRVRWRLADSSYRWMQAAGRPFADPQSGRLRRLVTFRDVDDQVRVEHREEETARLYRLLAENSSDVVIVSDLQGTSIWASPSTLRVLGWRPDQIVGHNVGEFLHPDDIDRTRTELERSARTDTPARITYRLRKADGDYAWFEAEGQNLPPQDGGPGRRIVHLRDVDERAQAERELARSERMYRLLATHVSDIVWAVDEEGTLQWISPSVTAMLGWETADLVGEPSSALVAEEDRSAFTDTVAQAIRLGAATGEFRFRRADDSTLWMEASLRQADSDSGAARVGTLRDIHDRVAARSRLEFALGHDQSTGLPKRETILEQLTRTGTELPDETPVAVITIGVDLLKDVNDAFGHDAGDIVVTTVAARIAEALPRPELLGRGTGDEFIVAVIGIAGPTEAADLAERLRTCVHGPIDAGEHRVTPTVSVGIALGELADEPHELLRDATLAMHRAKALGRDRWVFADAAQASEAARRMAVESAIRSGLDHDEFEPWYQPIVALADGRLAGYEALVRWQRDGEHLQPDEFLDVAGQTPMMSEIDIAMVEPVIARLADLPEPLYVAVNVSAPTLARPEYTGIVQAALDAHHVRPGRLHIEVTETLLLSINPDIVARMRELADLGVKWYVDDFGTGYSSISHLRDLPVAGLKLDRSFTAGIGAGDRTARQLADALIGLAHGLGLDTVAEGVETDAEAAYLRTVGWHHGQGWLYGKAAPLP